MTTQPLPHLGDWITVAAWRSRGVSLLLIPDDQGADLTQTDDIGGKRALLDAEGTLLALWTGRYRTEARIVGDDEREAIRAALA